MSANSVYALDPGFKTLIASAGARHEDVLRRAGLPEDLLNRANTRVDGRQFYAFVEALEQAIDDPLFPLRLVEGATAESFSPPVFAALCSPNLTVGLMRLARFKPLVAPVQLEVETSTAGLRITYDWEACGAGPGPFLVGSEALFLVKLARMGTRHAVQATAVTLPEFPRERAAYEDYLGCSIQRDDQFSVSFSPEDAQRPFLTNNSSMWTIFEPQLRQRLADLEGTASFEARTQAVLVEGLPSGRASVEEVAKSLAVSPRTLQRRLRDEGTSFKAVVRGMRERLSRHYLATTQLSYSEIAYLLGFEEPNSFFRAFQSWTGSTPDTLRQSLQAKA